LREREGERKKEREREKERVRGRMERLGLREIALNRRNVQREAHTRHACQGKGGERVGVYG